MTKGELEKILVGRTIADVEVDDEDCFGEKISGDDGFLFVRSMTLDNGLQLFFEGSAQVDRDDVMVRVEV